MGDEERQDRSLDDIEGAVNDLLAKAEALADDVGHEIGDDEPHSGRREAEFFESGSDSEASLDHQLAQAEADVTTASIELGAAASPEPQRQVALPPKEGQGSAPRGTNETSAAAAGQTSGRAPVASSAGGPKPSEAEQPDRLVAAKLADPPFELASPRINRRALLSARVPREKLKDLSHTPIEGACALLDFIDRPFQMVSGRVRSWIGWIALVFAVAAGSIYLFFLR